MAPGHDGWDAALNRAAAAHGLLVALDFDGTLAPLQPRPDDSRIPDAAVAVLQRLAKTPGVALAIVTGRGLEDLAKLADVPEGTDIAGSHGAEYGTLGPDGLEREPLNLDAAQRSILAQAAARLAELADGGAWVERKPAAVVFHTRPVAARDAAAVLLAQAAAAGEALGARVMRGKEVIELGVLTATKAEAIRRLRARRRAGAVLYAGDDVTDESAFRALTGDDIGVKVGPGASAANLRVSGPAELVEFLDALARRLAA
jgi:trehalose-phosphatase